MTTEPAPREFRMAAELPRNTIYWFVSWSLTLEEADRRLAELTEKTINEADLLDEMVHGCRCDIIRRATSLTCWQPD